jgi:hypothetical protein
MIDVLTKFAAPTLQRHAADALMLAADVEH